MKNTDQAIFADLFPFGDIIANTNIAIIKAIHTSNEKTGVFNGKNTRIDIRPKAAQFTGTVPLNPAHIMAK